MGSTGLEGMPTRMEREGTRSQPAGKQVLIRLVLGLLLVSGVAACGEEWRPLDITTAPSSTSGTDVLTTKAGEDRQPARPTTIVPAAPATTTSASITTVATSTTTERYSEEEAMEAVAEAQSSTETLDSESWAQAWAMEAGAADAAVSPVVPGRPWATTFEDYQQSGFVPTS